MIEYLAFHPVLAAIFIESLIALFCLAITSVYAKEGFKSWLGNALGFAIIPGIVLQLFLVLWFGPNGPAADIERARQRAQTHGKVLWELVYEQKYSSCLDVALSFESPGKVYWHSPFPEAERWKILVMSDEQADATFKCLKPFFEKK